MDQGQQYSVTELIHEASFRRMVNGTASPEEIDRWGRWMEASDENRQKAKKAISEITGFSFTDPADIGLQEQWARLSEDTVNADQRYSPHVGQKDRGLRWIYRVAAAVLLVVSVGYGVHLYEVNKPEAELEQITQQETVTTQPNQQKTLKFTSGSRIAKVVLNGSSTLTYNVGLLKDQPIEISLEGEAFFDVEEGFSENPAFSVVTPDGVIEDIGTQFLVAVEEDRSRVILQEGRVNVRTGKGQDSIKEFQLSKDQMLEFDNINILKQERVNSTLYTSWATGFMQFDQTDISTVADYIEQRYDVQAVLNNEEVSGITLEGAVYFKSLEGLMQSISDIAKIDVYQSHNRDTVYIGKTNLPQ
ncbi:FecR family protein [Halalkalibaculum sp. DA384]|uniref:FecR family protein n=1 Tax=Halalkalibaculum sp. DA384 TaxID=3373606 RepID=UPI003754BF87